MELRSSRFCVFRWRALRKKEYWLQRRKYSRCISEHKEGRALVLGWWKTPGTNRGSWLKGTNLLFWLLILSQKWKLGNSLNFLLNNCPFFKCRWKSTAEIHSLLWKLQFFQFFNQLFAYVKLYPSIFYWDFHCDFLFV